MEEVDSLEMGDSEEEYEREQLEIALYSQIHFEENNEALQVDEYKNEIDECFQFSIQGNNQSGYLAYDTTADSVLNMSIEEKYGPLMLRDHLTKSRENREKLKDRALKKAKLGLANKCNSDNETMVISDSDEVVVTDSDGDSVYGLLGDQESDDDNIQMNVHSLGNKSPDDNSHMWAINRADSGLNTASKKGRYYKPIECFNCRLTGHLSKNCTQPKKAQICSFCSELGHISRNCPDAFCFNCEEPGHEAKRCDAPKRSLFFECKRCNMGGHGQAKCPDIWRQYHLTISLGKLNQQKVFKKVRRADSCYNCGEQGHLGHECEEDRMSRFVCVHTPFICSYKPGREFRNIERRGDFEDSSYQNFRKRKFPNTSNYDESAKYSRTTDYDNETDRNYSENSQQNRNIKTLRDSRKTYGVPDDGTWKELGSYLRPRSRKTVGNIEQSKKKKLSAFIPKKGNKSENLTGRNNFDNLQFTIRQEDISATETKTKTIKKGKKTEKKKNKKTSKDVQNNKSEEIKTVVECVIDITGDGENKETKVKKSKESEKIKHEVKDSKQGSKKRKKKKDKIKKSTGEVKKLKSESTAYLEQKMVDIPKEGSKSDVKGKKDIAKKKEKPGKRKPGMKHQGRDDFPRGGRFNNMSITFDQTNTLRTVGVGKSKKKYNDVHGAQQLDDLFSIQKLQSVSSGRAERTVGDTGIQDVDGDIEHQAYHNEWWEKKKKRKRSKKNKKKTNDVIDLTIEVD